MPSKTNPRYAFAITSLNVQCFGTILEITITTNLPRHLFYYFQQTKPPSIPTTYPNRLSTRRHSQDISFVSEGGRDQLEPGDTLTHTYFVEVDSPDWNLWGYWFNSNPLQHRNARSPMVHLHSDIDCSGIPPNPPPQLLPLATGGNFDTNPFLYSLAWQPPANATTTDHLLLVTAASSTTDPHGIAPPVPNISTVGDLAPLLLAHLEFQQRNLDENTWLQFAWSLYHCVAQSQIGPQTQTIEVTWGAGVPTRFQGVGSFAELVNCSIPGATLNELQYLSGAAPIFTSLGNAINAPAFGSIFFDIQGNFLTIPGIQSWSQAWPPEFTATWAPDIPPGADIFEIGGIFFQYTWP